MRVAMMLSLILLTVLTAAAPYQQPADAEQITALVADMEAAVLAGDAETYLSYVDLRESIFATEHTNWVTDWAEDDFLTEFSLAVHNIVVEDDVARASLTMTWATSLPEQPGQTAVFLAQFTFLDGEWLYAGEYWETTETEHFIIHTVPGLQSTVDFLLPNLPLIYENVTVGYGYVPDTQMQIKLYASREAMGATILLSLPLISGWNEPGESLKVIGFETDRLSMIVAHEFTHFLTFEQAGGQPLMPWWALEGVAVLLAEPFDRRGADAYDAGRMATVRYWLENDEFAAWDTIADFEVTPVQLWRNVYPQGYAFMRFVTEVYGAETRIEWLHLMGPELGIDAATEAVFDVSFDVLDQEFREWMLAFDAG